MFKSDGIFSRFMNRLWDILFTGILWMLFTIPVITAGASVTAAYYAMAKCVRHKTGYIWKEFWHSFRSNLKQSLPLTCIFGAISVMLVFDIWYVWNSEETFASALFMVFIFIVFADLGIICYLFPLLSRFRDKNIGLVKMAAVIMFRFLPLTILLLLLAGASCLGIYLMPWAVFVIPGVYLYIVSYPMEWVMGKIAPPVEEGSEEAQKWYYQE